MILFVIIVGEIIFITNKIKMMQTLKIMNFILQRSFLLFKLSHQAKPDIFSMLKGGACMQTQFAPRISIQ